MTDRYLELGANEKIKDSYQRIPAAFDKVKADVEDAAKGMHGDFAFFPPAFEGKNSPYNLAVIEGIREDIPFTEFWILVNAWYDRSTKRFKRKDIDNFSFGWQFQGGGTYPGEGAFGDFINQGVNLWRALGRKAFAEGDPMRDQIGEDIGYMNAEGQWIEYATMYGWNNCFMTDSYGGMTIGGQGFEIDGNGVFPFKRVSLGMFQGGSSTGLPREDYVYAYNAMLWNAYHGLFDSDDKASDSFLFGMRCPINFYDGEGGSFNPYSNRASMENTEFVWSKRAKNTPHTIESWKDIFCLKDDGEFKVNGNHVSVAHRVNATISGGNFTASYPAGYNKSNTFVQAVIGTKANGDRVQLNGAVTLSTNISGTLNDTYSSVSLLISKY